MEHIDFGIFLIDTEIQQAISDLGYRIPTEVQQEVIPLALQGRDIIVKSQTGSGKTAAFAIPICQKLDIEERDPQALILEPTRELALQVQEYITNIGRYKKVRCTVVFGKHPITLQIRDLKQRVHAIVGTPGRVLDHIKRGNIHLEKIRYLVLDEADKMLSMGFLEEVEMIIKSIPQSRITMLFSATLPEAIEVLCDKYMIKAVEIEINPESLTVEKIDQWYYEIDENKKFGLLNRVLLIENPDSCIIFCRTKERVDILANKMRLEDYSCGKLHGGMLQNDRFAIMEKFKRGEFRFLVATDVAARGIDVEDISHIINYDISMENESYVHRIGRTGRAGNKGVAITFVTPYEDKFLQNIQKYIGMEICNKEIPSAEEAERCREFFLGTNKVELIIKEDKTLKLNEKIMRLYIHAGKYKKIRPTDIVGAISNIDGISAEDIGIIDIQDHVSYVEILNDKGGEVFQQLKETKIKGKLIKVEIAK